MLKRGLIAVVALALAAAVALALGALGGGDPAPHHAVAKAPPHPVPKFGATAAAQAELWHRLDRGTARAAALGAQVQAGAWIAGQDDPVIAGTDPTRRMRLWSMSKPFGAIATLRAIGHPQPSWLEPALEDLIERSENCPMRELMVELQRRSGSVAAARQDLTALFHSAGADGIEVATEVEPPEAECRQRLERDGIPTPDADALLTGTSTWTIDDAVHAVHALASGRFGAEGARLLSLMRRPKAPSEEIASPDDYTADPAWGAGRALAGLDPAYKPGWGGTLQGEFMVGQLVVAPAAAPAIAIAVMVHTDVQPDIDDPGRTVGPRAVEDVLAAVRPLIPRLDLPADSPTIAHHGGRAG